MEKQTIIHIDNLHKEFVVGDEIVRALRASYKIHEENRHHMGEAAFGQVDMLNILAVLTTSSGTYEIDGIQITRISTMP